ncbi:MAG: IS66 family insertion sequence element accessory protein TnpA [Roseburia intestinalis]
MECRKSGKTDAQWCIENGIRPATFYNWVSRLRTLRCEIFFCKFRSSMIIDAA